MVYALDSTSDNALMMKVKEGNLDKLELLLKHERGY